VETKTYIPADDGILDETADDCTFFVKSASHAQLNTSYANVMALEQQKHAPVGKIGDLLDLPLDFFVGCAVIVVRHFFRFLSFRMKTAELCEQLKQAKLSFG
jgi:hypothetical protein